MMKRFLLLSYLLTTLSGALEVSSCHPLLTDWARQVGGSKVNVYEVIKPGRDLHSYRPNSADLRAISKAHLILASGKNMEPYLKKIQDSLRSGQKIVEVGRTIPSQIVSAKDAAYACCAAHTHNALDPHWWHNVSYARRAVKVIEKEFSKADPANAAYYKANAKAARAKLAKLHSWVKAMIGQIPKSQRHLVTAHAAFGYFCKAYGMKATYVQGLSKDGEISSRQLADTIRTLRQENIRTVFPETQANPKVLKQIAKESGSAIGSALIADGSYGSYEKMIQRNVTIIVEGLK